MSDVLISFTIPACNRTDDLKQTMPHLIAAAKASPPVELSILDYNSTDGLEDFINEVREQEPWLKIAYRKYTGRNYYHTTHARNLSMLNATGDYLILFGTDYYPYPNCLPTIRRLIAETDPDWLHTSGGRLVHTCVVKKDQFIAAGGFDERFEFYGPEDKEFFARMTRRGLKTTILPKGLFEMIYTPDSKRVLNYRLKISKYEMSAMGAPFFEESEREQTLVANVGREWGKWDA